MKLYFVTLISIVFFTVTGCQKKDETPVQPNKVNIDLTSPYELQKFRNGDTVLLKANVSYVSQMHGYTVTISDKITGEVFYSNEDHAHGDHFSIDEYWVDTLSMARQLKVNVVTIIDHENHTANKEIEIEHQP